MTPEIITIIATGIALGAAILPGQRALQREIASLQRDFGNLRERMARVEGYLRALRSDRRGNRRGSEEP